MYAMSIIFDITFDYISINNFIIEPSTIRYWAVSIKL